MMECSEHLTSIPDCIASPFGTEWSNKSKNVGKNDKKSEQNRPKNLDVNSF